MTEKGSSGRRPGPVRRLASSFFAAEERPAVSGADRTADVAIAVVATIAAVVAVIIQARGSVVSGVIFVQPGFRAEQFTTTRSTWPSLIILLGAALTTAPLAFRRIYPITVFWMVMAAILATHQYATSITFAAAILAAYSAVAYSPFRRVAEVSVVAAALIVTAGFPDTSAPLPARFTALLVLTLTVAVGMAIRTWRRRAGESAERLRRAEAEHEAETRRAVALERARIASEMHDVVTHNVSVMVVQAGAARRVLDSSPEDAREALLAVEASGRTAMAELRNLLGLLAPSGEAEPGPAGMADVTLAPQPDLSQIGSLIDRLCAAGLPVELSVAGQRDLPPSLGLAAYRVVQEALTNVLKHAGQARTTVRIEYRPAELLITVCDDGHPGAVTPPDGDGRGLIGLRERIAVYGGELDAGPRPGGGWRLAARIPLDPAAGDLPARPEFQRAGP